MAYPPHRTRHLKKDPTNRGANKASIDAAFKVDDNSILSAIQRPPPSIPTKPDFSPILRPLPMFTSNQRYPYPVPPSNFSHVHPVNPSQCPANLFQYPVNLSQCPATPFKYSHPPPSELTKPPNPRSRRASKMGTESGNRHPSLTTPPTPRLTPVDLPPDDSSLFTSIQVHSALKNISLPLVNLITPPTPRLTTVALPPDDPPLFTSIQVHSALKNISLPLLDLKRDNSFETDVRPATIPKCRKLILYPGPFVETFTLKPPDGESHLKVRDVIYTLKIILQTKVPSVSGQHRDPTTYEDLLISMGQNVFTGLTLEPNSLCQLNFRSTEEVSMKKGSRKKGLPKRFNV